MRDHQTSKKIHPSTSDPTSPAPPITNHDLDLANLKVIQQIRNSRFPVFLVYSPALHEKCVLKIYPYEGTKVHNSFLSESRFSSLSHPNIIPMLGFAKKQKTTSGNHKFYASCLLVKLAPFGDFNDLVIKNSLYRDQILIRTIFHQLVSGVEYLHSLKISHLDLKLENLLLGGDFQLKITDFDLSYLEGDKAIRGRGTCNYRAPELKYKACREPPKADVYSLGIILFIFKTGVHPYLEDSAVDEYNLYELMHGDPDKFWEAHEKLQCNEGMFESSFRELFMGMVAFDPEERWSLDDVKESEWYNGKVYSEKEHIEKLKEFEISKETYKWN